MRLNNIKTGHKQNTVMYEALCLTELNIDKRECNAAKKQTHNYKMKMLIHYNYAHNSLTVSSGHFIVISSTFFWSNHCVFKYD